MPTPSKLDKRSRRKLIRWGIITGNVVLLLAIAIFVIVNGSTSQTVRTSTVNSATSTAGSLASPLDQLSSAQIALAAAQMTKLPELAAVRSEADSQAALLSIVPSGTDVIAKPQIVSTSQKSKYNIIRYTTVNGDSVSSLATKFGVSTNSIRWSNGSIVGESLTPGVNLLIPPAEGVVYQVKAGDSVDSIVNRYRADRNAFVNANDAENGLPVGQYVWIPNGTQPSASLSTAFYGFAYGWSGPSYSGNAYDFGWCTWYVYNRRAQLGRPVPSNLGNAYTWYIIAKNMGLPTGFTPQIGAVAVNEGGNHVSVIEQVNGDGSFWASEMNSRGQVSMTDPTPAGGWSKIDWKLYSSVGNLKFIY